MLDMCSVKLKGKRRMYSRSDGTQSCYLVLAAECYRQPVQFILSVPLADRPRLTCSNQGGGYQSGDISCIISSSKTNFLVNLYWDNKDSDNDSDSDSFFSFFEIYDRMVGPSVLIKKKRRDKRC